MTSLTILCVAASLLTAPEATPATAFPRNVILREVSFAGLHRYAAAPIVAATGLKTGETILMTGFQDASQRLHESGLFKSVRARYVVINDTVDVTFDVEEIEWGVPVLFDNFVWFDKDELRAAVARDVPSFDGTAPRVGGVLKTITRTLQRLIEAKGIRGSVEYLPDMGLGGGAPRPHVYTVQGAVIPIGSLTFPGASAVTQEALADAAVSLIGVDYSNRHVNLFVELTLLPLYQDRGYLRARFGEPTVKPGGGPGSIAEFAVTIPITEGLGYRWEHAEWVGSTLFGPSELDATMGMRAGEVASKSKLNKGLAAVRAAYQKRGYLEVELSVEPRYDDQVLRVVSHVAIAQGELWRMGRLSMTGLPEGAIARLKARWKLAQGDAYDSSYPKAFLEKELPTVLPMSQGPVSVDTRESRDSDTRTVDLSIAIQ